MERMFHQYAYIKLLYSTWKIVIFCFSQFTSSLEGMGTVMLILWS